MGDVEDSPEMRRGLLETKKSFVEGCPGCLLELNKSRRKGLPKKELFSIGIIVLANVLPISSLFPYIYFLAKSFDIVKSDKDIGFYAGFVGASFMFGRFLSSTLWGVIADKYGRKPVFIFSIVEVIIFNTWFGFTNDFWMAITLRFFLGFLNGALGPIRAYASELCSVEHQAFAISVVGTIWGLGLIIGPAIGGYLAQPSINYPSIFSKGSLFDQYPFLLPPLSISAVAVVSLFVCFTLPESLHKHPVEVETVEPQSGDENISEVAKTKSEKSNGNQKKENGSVFKNKGLWASIIVNCIWSLHDMGYSESFSLWAVSPKEYGGLGFSTSNVGTVLSVTGVFLLVFQLVFFATLANMFGAITVTRLPAMLCIPLLVIFPLIPRLNGVALWIVLMFTAVSRNVLSSCTITGSLLLINNSVTSKQRGLANGISMAGTSLFRAVGPALAGVLFSWCQKRLDASFLPGNWMLFTILIAISLVAIVATFEPFLPRSVDHPIEAQSNEEKQLVRRHSSFMD